MLPTRCTIPYPTGTTKEPLLRLCVAAMYSFGQWVREDSEGNDWDLGRPAETAAAAINVARWIGWTATWIGEDEITADTAELIAALDELERFADRRLSDLGAKSCETGDSVNVIIAAPAEQVETIRFFFEARSLCRDLRGKIDAETARWTIDRAERDELRPAIVRELTKGYRASLAALRRGDWAQARDCGRDCVSLIDALNRLDWAEDPAPDAETFGLPEQCVLKWIAPASATAKRRLAVLAEAEA